MKNKIIYCVVGTRPEAIKMAPVILALRKERAITTKVVSTAQHRLILDQILNHFQIKPDIDLDVMSPNQALSLLTARLLIEMEKVFSNERPDVVLVQGDTTTVMAVSLICFYHRIPVGHIEAGLRSWNLENPFPEEANRVITSRLAKWHFSPTEGSRQNLLREGVDADKVYVTGNTVIDALLETSKYDNAFSLDIPSCRRFVLVTSHRRENFGEPFSQICLALKLLAENNPDVHFFYPVHPNPNIRQVALDVLNGISNITLSDPLEYPAFVAAMKQSYLILSDSGGVQEEAPALGKPVLVLRDETERPEAIKSGVVKLVGTNSQNIVKETQILLDNHQVYKKMAKGISPYGDGKAASRIVNMLNSFLSL